ncbi:hypothetical protein SAMN05421503_0198 [Terribacillus aidingensis]|uniref:Uncharacterized protein n=1 Tax=Terribacillus aidingensis TaxID=586416 RepID=A0A285N494_9BACI|nr:hypothetical protein SAMN05421503_0198 [Terribacillus aidingensis]
MGKIKAIFKNKEVGFTYYSEPASFTFVEKF